MHQELARSSTRAFSLNKAGKRGVRDTIVPVLIGFLRRFASPLKEGAFRQTDGRRDFTRSDDPAHIRSRPDWAVPICLDRHNSATDLSVFIGKPNDMDPSRTQPMQERPRQAPLSRLPKSWAKAGAFSLLTPGSKLAQY
jgi:hypothetical protein